MTVAQPDSILIRPCLGFEELSACVQIQTDVWGYGNGDVIPRRAFIVTQRIGGQVIGAYDTARFGDAGSVPGAESAAALVGFAMSLPGVHTVPGGSTGPQRSTQPSLQSGSQPGSQPDPRPSSQPGRPYLHSHMLAVRPEYRDRGIGRRLKLFQREEALGRGIDHMEWTFDPLEGKNAYLNLVKLGAIVRAYSPNFYGVSSSRLQGGLPTDRLHAEWWMNSDRVQSAIRGEPIPPPQIEQTIQLPGNIQHWKSSPTVLARVAEIQARNRELFEQAFARGLVVVGFARDGEGNGTFQLSRWQHDVELSSNQQEESSASHED